MNIKKSTIALIIVALVGVMATPVAQAKSFSFVSLQNGINSLFVRAEAGENDNVISSVGAGIFSNSEVRDARNAYRDAVKNANEAYRDARKTARDKLRSALNSAGNDFAKRLAAYRVYVADLMAAFKAKSSAKEAAMQIYINALLNIQAQNQAPTANSQSVTTNKNTSKIITLTGSDVEGSALSFYVVTNPTHGTLSGTVPSLTYLPATDYTGSDSFTFKVNDGTQDSAAATVSITVNP